MIESLFFLFCFLILGEFISTLLTLPIPGSVIGMVLLTVALEFNIVKAETVKPSSKILLNNLSLLFIPPGVGLMVYFNIINEYFLPIVISYFVSTFAVLYISGIIVQRLDRS